jgi:hypothetical protein
MTIDQICANYEAATETFLVAAAAVPTSRLDLHTQGEWSARQVIHHMADSETQSYARLRRLLCDPEGSLIQGYDEAAWARNETLGYTSLPVEHSLAVVRAVRGATLDILRRLSIADLARFGEHSESGRYDVATWVETYCDHPSNHARQLSASATN